MPELDEEACTWPAHIPSADDPNPHVHPFSKSIAAFSPSLCDVESVMKHRTRYTRTQLRVRESMPIESSLSRAIEWSAAVRRLLVPVQCESLRP